MALTLELSSSELAQDDLQEQTRQLCLEFRGEGVEATLAEGEAVTGHKGVELGAVLIATLGSSVLSAFIGVLTAYVQRAKAVTVKLQKDGQTIEVSANNVDEVEALLAKYRLEAQ